MSESTMKLVEVATRRRVAISMLAVTLVLFGLIALRDLKVNLLPELSYPTLTVRTEYQGAAPEEIETLLTRPVEEAVGVVKNVRTIRSVSRSGQSDVILEFAWGTDMDLAGLEVREKLEVLQLPLQAGRPSLLRFNPATDPIMRLALVATGEAAESERSLKALRRFADEEVRKRLEPVEGVAAVKISGGLEDEIQVEIDQRKMAQFGISLTELSSRLAAENVNVSAGRLEQGTQRYLVRTMNQFTSVEEIADMIVSPGTQRPVYLRDIARVHAGFTEREAIIRLDGQEAVELAIYKEGDANTVAVARAMNSLLETLRGDLPADMALQTVDDQSIFIERAIGEVVNAAIFGGVLAVLVIFAFLRNFWFTFTIALSIPVSIIATFFLMGQAGISLNIMSLGGIALATGLLVDNAIVVLENISRYRAQGLSGREAAMRGASEVGSAVIASTLTTIAVFLPLAFVEGVAGQLFRDQALTVAFALIVSLGVAMTLIPMMAAMAGRGGSGSGKRSRRFSGAGFGRGVLKAYGRVLRWALRHSVVVLVFAALLLAGSVMLIRTMGTELLPPLEQGRFEVSLESAPGTPLEQTDRLQGRLQALATGTGDVDYVYSVSGSGNRIDANPTESGENYSEMLVVLAPETSPGARQDLVARLRATAESIAGLEANFSAPKLLSFDKPLEIEVYGYNLDQLRTVSAAIVERLHESDRFADIESSVEQGHPEIQIFFDQERAAALGLTVKELSDLVVGKIRGEVATRYNWRDRKIDVLVRLSESERQSIEAVRNLIVNPSSPRPVPLSSLAEIRVAEGPAEIRRGDQERMALIEANLAYGDLGAAVEETQALLAGMRFPPGISVGITGQSEEMKASFRSLLFALALAVFLVYLVMASQFESLLHPLVILLAIPLALVGVALALWLTDTSLSVIVFIGLIMLAGIVVNNAIVLIDLINQLRAQGTERMAAITEAAQLRFRPIMMTSLTTVLGLLPMALGLGEGAEMRTPMAVTVIGGLLVSTLLTLVVVPVMYALMDRRREAADAEGTEPWPLYDSP